MEFRFPWKPRASSGSGNAADFYKMVNHKSGLLGVSETRADMRDLLDHRAIISSSSVRFVDCLDSLRLREINFGGSINHIFRRMRLYARGASHNSE
jgi:hypothetical protein